MIGQKESLITMRVDGGASTNDWLMQCQANVSAITIERPIITEATALGAAICAAHTSTCWPTIDLPIEQSFLPNCDPAQMQSLHQQWERALALTLP